MRVIKKYSNRRLYDTSSSRYVNLDELAALVRAGEEVQVLDANNGEDLTRNVLLQVVLEGNGGAELFPVGLLHRIIRYGAEGVMQRAMLKQVSLGLELLDVQVTRFERQFGWLRPDVAPPDVGSPSPPPEPEPEPGPRGRAKAGAAPETDELDALRDRLASLKGRLRGKN
jgi:polyhydroxyalkanoate synthesis repressor PhaR